jgi:hypothetical protein
MASDDVARATVDARPGCDATGIRGRLVMKLIALYFALPWLFAGFVFVRGLIKGDVI